VVYIEDMNWTVTEHTGSGSPEYASSEGHRLSKVGKRYVLTHPDGHSDDLGKRATFDHAERAIAAHRQS
jgi:hypothetical protein